MERFDVKRGMVKQITADGGLAVLAKKYFEVVKDKKKIIRLKDSNPFKK